MSALQRWLDDARPEDVAGACDAAPGGHPAGTGVAAGAGRGAAVTRRGHAASPACACARVINEAGDDLRVSFGDRTLTVPSSTRPALDAVVSGTVLAAGSLPGLNEADSLVLARRLLREALVVPVDAPRD